MNQVSILEIPIRQQIVNKEKELEDLKFQLALKELVKDIQVNTLSSNVIKDVKFVTYDITQFTLVNKKKGVLITFKLNDNPIEIKFTYDYEEREFNYLQIEERVKKAIVEEITKQLYNQIFGK